MKTLQLMVFLAIASCAPRAIPVGIPTAPRKSIDVAPAVTKTRELHSAASSSADRLQTQVNDVRDRSAELATSISAATREADRLRSLPVIAPADITSLWQQLTVLDATGATLARESFAAARIAESNKADRDRESKALAELATAAADRDAETEALRLQRGDLATSVERQAKTIAAVQDDAAVGNWIRRCFLIGAIVVCLIFVGWLYLRSSPLSLLRR